jgi:enoyl-CoA hydratase
MTPPKQGSKVDKVLYEKDGRIGRITLNRPEVMNAIDDDLPGEFAAAVAEADADPAIHVMVLAGNVVVTVKR